ncbi:MAG: hypothetical protein RLZZ354_101, partial [Pseudomonadota bacterium]
KKNRGINSTFTVRKISFGEGVERLFPVHSPNVESVEVIRSGKVRRAKLYYLRERTGKSARITEKIRKKIGVDIIQPLPKKEAVQNIEAKTDIAVEQAPKNKEKASAPKTEVQNKKK